MTDKEFKELCEWCKTILKKEQIIIRDDEILLEFDDFSLAISKEDGEVLRYDDNCNVFYKTIFSDAEPEEIKKYIRQVLGLFTWEDLLEWVENLKNNRVKVINYNDNSGKKVISFYSPAIDLKFYDGGDIYTFAGCLRGNRTPAQMKSIIENLL